MRFRHADGLLEKARVVELHGKESWKLAGPAEKQINRGGFNCLYGDLPRFVIQGLLALRLRAVAAEKRGQREALLKLATVDGHGRLRDPA